MKYHLHENGWTVILEDFDLKQSTQDDINQIARLVSTNTLVIIRNQNLLISNEIAIAKMFKNPQQFHTEIDNSPDADFRGAEVENSENYALRVTGKKDKEGRTGIAGHTSEMHWHANDQTTPERRSIVWLYSVQGSKGSRTSWNNNILSYNMLDEEIRKPLESLQMTILKNVSLNENESNGNELIDNYTPNLVMENIAGKKGFYFPFLQISGFEGMSLDESQKVINWLSEYTIQEKFCYHHDWEDGDVVITEQWLGIHKRWPFESIEERLLHRMAFDFPDQDYKI
jgi:alpha-ketoglutarate-dependent taurine dioxygenase